jgi:CheY-like chemotaxis protein
MAADLPRRILIVEDDQEFVDDLLRSWTPPATVTVARSGQEAVRAIVRNDFDLILLDLSFPHYLSDFDDAEGFHLLAFVRQKLGLRTPVIVVTRNDSVEAREQAKLLGADGFVQKPVDIRELEEAVGPADSWCQVSSRARNAGGKPSGST